jgi:hypothetical protein
MKFDDRINDDCDDGLDEFEVHEMHLATSFLKNSFDGDTEEHWEPQAPHQDFLKLKLNEAATKGAPVPSTCHIPLSSDGQFLVVWDQNLKNPKILYIPFGFGLLLSGSVYHAGGFCFGNEEQKNFRMHFYILPPGVKTDKVINKFSPLPIEKNEYDPEDYFHKRVLRRLKFFILNGALQDTAKLSQVCVYEKDVKLSL